MLVLMTPAQAKTVSNGVSKSMSNTYNYFYPYFVSGKNINTIKPTDNIKTIRVPKISEVIKKSVDKITNIKKVVPLKKVQVINKKVNR